MGHTDLFVFRHGETDWNRETRFQGHTDIPLNELGLQQAKNLSKIIEKYKPEVILSSDLMRAKVTADLVNENLKLQIIQSPELRECQLGDPEGMPRAKVIEVFGQNALDRWHSIKPEDRDFCFPNGETKGAHQNRLTKYLGNFCKDHSNFERIAVSTHGGCISRLIHQSDRAPGVMVPIPNCVLYHLRFVHDSSRWIYLGRLH